MKPSKKKAESKRVSKPGITKGQVVTELLFDGDQDKFIRGRFGKVVCVWWEKSCGHNETDRWAVEVEYHSADLVTSSYWNHHSYFSPLTDKEKGR